MKMSPFIGTSQLQQLSLSKSLDEPEMRKRVVGTASSHLAINVPMVQPATSMSATQLTSTTPEQSRVVDGVKAEASKLSPSASQLLD